MKKATTYMLAMLILLLSGCGNKSNTASSKGRNSNDNGKTVITLGAFSGSDDGHLNYFIGVPNSGLFDYKASYDYLKDAVLYFNQSSEDYEIQIVDYGKYGGNRSDVLDRLNTDILTGNMPDMLLLNNLPYETYIRKGVFADLTSMFNTDGLFPGLLSAMKTDGRLFYISPENIAVTWFGLASNIGSNKLSISGLKNLLAESGDKTAFFSDDMYDRSLTGTELFRILYSGQRGKLINKVKGTCDLKTQDFIDMLELCKSLGEKTKDMEKDAYQESLVVSGELSFGVMSVTERGYYQYYKTIVSGKDISVLGIPGGEGAMCVMQLPIAVSAQSDKDNQRVACKFIQTLIDRDYPLHFGFLPLSQTVFDRELNKNFNYFSAWDNTKSQPIVKMPIIVDGKKTEIEASPFTHDDYDSMVKLINSATTVYYASAPEFEIVKEEAAAYFSGGETAEDCADKIQQRVSIYLAEQS